MRICYVCSEYPPCQHGGIGSMSRTLARALSRRGHRVRAVGCYADRCYGEEEDDDGVQVLRLPLPGARLNWFRVRLRLFEVIRRWSQAGEIDLVEVPDWEGHAAGWRRLPIPVITRLHGSLTYFATEMGQRVSHAAFWLERLSFRRADYHCSTSRYTAERSAELFGSCAHEIEVLFNPVEVAANGMARERDRNCVVYAGTLTPKKGIIQLLRAWPLVVAAHRSAELHIYGKDQAGPTGPSMRQYLLSLTPSSIRSSIAFHGHVRHEQVIAAFQTCRLAIFPSYSEAFCLAPMEAMAQRCPVIYTRRCSGPELIRSGVDGLLVDPDDCAGLAHDIIRLLSDEELAAQLGRAGRNRIAASFSTDVLVPKNERFYRACVEHFGQAQHLQFNPERSCTE